MGEYKFELSFLEGNLSDKLTSHNYYKDLRVNTKVLD